MLDWIFTGLGALYSHYENNPVVVFYTVSPWFLWFIVFSVNKWLHEWMAKSEGGPAKINNAQKLAFFTYCVVGILFAILSKNNYDAINISLFLSLAALTLSFVALWDDGIFKKVNVVESKINHSIAQLERMNGIMALPTLDLIMEQISSLLAEYTKNEQRHPKVMNMRLIASSPAIGALGDNPVRYRALQSLLALAAQIYQKDMWVACYDPSDDEGGSETSLKRFAKKMGYAEDRIERFENSARHLLEDLASGQATIFRQTLHSDVANSVFDADSMQHTVWAFHMFIVNFQDGSSEMVMWHIERPTSRSKQKEYLHCTGFWTRQSEFINAFSAQLEDRLQIKQTGG